MRVLAIIPCYNEELSLAWTVENLKQKASFIDFIVVNDGSRDATRQVCANNDYPMLDMPINLGLANAVQTGMRYACLNDYDMALQFDGDGQHLPEYIADMVTLMQNENADIVAGSRYMLKSSFSPRRFGGLLIRFAIKMTTGKTLTDPTSGMRLFNRNMMERFAWRMNYGPEPDTIAYLMKSGVKVVEVPVTMQERTAGTSYFNMLSIVGYMLRMFISILIVQWFRIKENEF